MKRNRNIASLICAAGLAVLLLAGSFNKAFAQQDPVYTQYMNNLMSVNPAYTGVRGVGSASLISRKQWLGIDGSPFTTSLTLALALDSLHVGGGMDFLYDNIGPTSTTALFLNYSYRIKATATSQISFGLKGGFNYLQANLIDLYRHDYNDEYILRYPDIHPFMPNFGVGIYWYSDEFYVGLAIPRLLQNKFLKEENSIVAASREERHYFLHGAYLFDLSPGLVFKPGITTIMVAGAPVTADFDFSFLLYDQVTLGAMYRISDGLGGYVQLQYDNFKFGISYDYSHTRLRHFNAGTFELMIRYDFRTKASQIMPLPRF